MEYPTYLVHFNKNHSKANGQFISGDGDGDGIIDDHAHRGKKEFTFKEKWQIGSGAAGIGLGAWTIYRGYKKGNKFVMAMGGLKIALSAYRIAKGAGFVDKVKDKFMPAEDENSEENKEENEE